MEDINLQKHEYLLRLNVVKMHYRDKILPDHLGELDLANLKTLYDRFIHEICEEKKLENMKTIYVKSSYAINFIYTDILKYQYGLIFELQEIGDLFQISKIEMCDKIQQLFQKLKHDMCIYGNLYQLIQGDLLITDILNKINLVDDENIDEIIKFFDGRIW